jgi:hypothetical protein
MEPVRLETRSPQTWATEQRGWLKALAPKPVQKRPMIQPTLAPGRRLVNEPPSLRCAIAQPADPGILIELGKPEDLLEHLPIASTFDEKAMEANYEACLLRAGLVAARVKRRIIVPGAGKTTRCQTQKTPRQYLHDVVERFVLHDMPVVYGKERDAHILDGGILETHHTQRKHVEGG